MNFLTGITNLTSWMGNVIMPTLAALFFALGVLRYAHGQAHTYAPWAGFLCLMVSGVLRGIEKFAKMFSGVPERAGIGHADAIEAERARLAGERGLQLRR